MLVLMMLMLMLIAAVGLQEWRLFIERMDPPESPEERGPTLEAVTPLFRSYDLDGDAAISAGEFGHLFGRIFRAGGPNDAPQQIHLSLTNDPAEMNVQWAQAQVRPPPSLLMSGRRSADWTDSVVFACVRAVFARSDCAVWIECE
jgi:hypothetical protein